MIFLLFLILFLGRVGGFGGIFGGVDRFGRFLGTVRYLICKIFSLNLGYLLFGVLLLSHIIFLKLFF